MSHKAIILAGGTGTRLHPVTKAVNKHLLPIYNKPMIYYPLTTLIEGGIREILIISTKTDLTLFHTLLGDGSEFGIKLDYAIQEKPNGISEAFIIGKDFIGDDNVTLILGDNIFWGDDFTSGLNDSIGKSRGGFATIFGYKVKDPSRYGVMEFDDVDRLIGVEEKPTNPKSNYAIIGMYTYPNNVVEYVNDVKLSPRGELEITSLNDIYLKKGELRSELIGNDSAWLDSGTHESLMDASRFVETVETRTGIKIGCPTCHLRKD